MANSYVREQNKWLQGNGVAVGSKVKITRIAQMDENGWDNAWTPTMFDAVGKVGEVVEIDGVNGIRVVVGDSDYEYPYFVLEPVQATETKIYEHNGKKYRLADHRDIGKDVYVDDLGFESAMEQPCFITLTGYEKSWSNPYKEAVACWKFAFVELEEPVPAVVPFNGTLEVGQWYETNNCRRLYCSSRTHHDTYPMVMVQEDGGVVTYMENGWWIEDHGKDAEDSIALQLVGCTGFDWTKPVEPAVVVGPDPVLEVARPLLQQIANTRAINDLCETIHAKNVAAGWWDQADNPLIVPVKLMLAVTELAEAVEGDRKSIPDTHLTHRSMLSVELADAVIRIADLAGFLKIPLGTVIAEKEAYNASRADHKPENRKAVGGKRY